MIMRGTMDSEFEQFLGDLWGRLTGTPAATPTPPAGGRTYGPVSGSSYAPTPAPSSPAPRVGSTAGAPDVVVVRGVTVARAIAPQIARLLAAAEADGVRLSGGGFRTPDQQIALRRKNCGTSQYDIYEKPSSQCTPMTARPGSSNHERGLAIDFTYNGASISTRDNPGFRWLAANAGRYGLCNLPKEPWHWSVDGK
jgi:hypothetical protein